MILARRLLDLVLTPLGAIVAAIAIAVALLGGVALSHRSQEEESHIDVCATFGDFEPYREWCR